MRSELKLARARRARRRSLIVTVCAAVAVGAVATTGMAVTAPLSAPGATGLSAVFTTTPASLV